MNKRKYVSKFISHFKYDMILKKLKHDARIAKFSLVIVYISSYVALTHKNNAHSHVTVSHKSTKKLIQVVKKKLKIFNQSEK